MAKDKSKFAVVFESQTQNVIILENKDIESFCLKDRVCKVFHNGQALIDSEDWNLVAKLVLTAPWISDNAQAVCRFKHSVKRKNILLTF